jgi:hypothetical protein
MAKTTMIVCDECGASQDGKGASMRVSYLDARRGVKAADLCGKCADAKVGTQQARRGRPRSHPA